MKERVWMHVAHAGVTTEAEARARLQEASAEALVLLRRELIDLGVPQALVARGLADLWVILMTRIDEQLPILLARLNQDAPGSGFLH